MKNEIIGARTFYYTPKIEEFCVGFEYQIRLNESLWVKRIVTVEAIPEIDTCLRICPEKIRVQYPNINDFLKEGWREEYPGFYRYFGSKRVVFSLRHGEPDSVIIEKTICPISTPVARTTIIFDGKIKNVYELRRILGMITNP